MASILGRTMRRVAQRIPTHSRTFATDAQPLVPRSTFSFKKALKWTAGGALLAGVGTTTYALQDQQTREFVVRGSRFSSTMVPLALHYLWTEYRTRDLSEEEREERYEELHKKYVDDVVQMIRDLKGVYVKFAQVMSVRSEVVPKTYRDGLATLQDSVYEEMSLEATTKFLEERFSAKLEDVFESIDLEKPLAGASIAQVYAARLKSTYPLPAQPDGHKLSRDVVVKVQLPETKRLFQIDLSILTNYSRLFYPEVYPIVQNATRQLLSEFDFLRESASLQQVSVNMAKHFPGEVFVPRPILSNEFLIVMERVHGVKIYDVLNNLFTKLKPSIARYQSRNDTKKEDDETKDERQGPPRMFDESLQKKIKWAVRVILFVNKIIQNTNNTIGSLVFRMAGLSMLFSDRKELSHFCRVIHTEDLVTLMLKVHGKQIFEDGLFNGDPHPGNIMIMDDGRVGLIDFGQVCSLTLPQRLSFSRLMVSLHEKDADKTISAFKEMGIDTSDLTEEQTLMIAQLMYNEENMEEMQKMGPIMHKIISPDTPTPFFLLSRTGLLLRGLARISGHPIKMSDYWYQPAVDLLSSQPKN